MEKYYATFGKKYLQKTGSPDRIYNEFLEQYRTVGQYGYVVVVGDQYIDQLQCSKSRLVLTLMDGGNEQLKSSLNHFIRNEWKPNIIQKEDGNISISIGVKAWGLNNSLSQFIVVAFCAFYLCIIFIVFAANLLSFLQISFGIQSKGLYKILGQLGVSKFQQEKIARLEVRVLFLVPLVVPIIVLFAISALAWLAYSSYILNPMVIPSSLLLSLAILVGIYGCYYFISYNMYRGILFGDK